MMISSKTLFNSIALLSALVFVKGFQAQPAASFPSNTRFQTGIAASNNNDDNNNCLDEDSACLSRRNMLKGTAATMSVFLSGSTIGSQPAAASYSAYTNREKDWSERQSKGDIKYSSASSLRAQLREIAPMNDEGTKIFCPNGTSAAVSPMMENKCSDRQALPSVYGRSTDSMGNSIPGFGGDSPSLLRAQLEEQSYFRSN